MIADPSRRLVVIPAAPLLLPGSTGRDRVRDVDLLRDHVDRAVRWLRESGRPIAVVTGGENRRWSSSRVGAAELGFEWIGDLGVPVGPEIRTDVPTGLLVAAAYAGRSLTGAIASTDGTPVSTEGSSILLVGSGSARRRDGAPGYIDARAVPHDAQTEQLLRTGAIQGWRPDLGLATALLDDLRAPLAAVCGELTTPRRTWLDYCDDPFGVAYFVARWEW